MKPGVRVLRGPDWRTGDHDGGVGYLGTVVKILQNNKVLVRWDIGTETECRAGTNGAFDLRIYDNAPIGIKCSRATCNMCEVKENQIQGMRWKCLTCRDFDLCMKCYYSDRHEKCSLSHSCVLFTTPRSTVIPVLSRRKSKKTKVYGIFPGADVIKAIVAPKEEQTVGKVVELVDLAPEGYRGAVTVRWPKNKANDNELPVYRVGAGGKMELKLATPFSPGYVYLDHLPNLDLRMPMDVIINPGDEVSVNLNLDAFMALNKDYHCWSPELEDLFTNTGHVLDTEEPFVIVKTKTNPSIKVYMHTLTKIYPIKAGDKVKIVNDMEKVKKGQMRHGGWQDTLIPLLGTEGQVERVDESGDIHVLIRRQSYIFNPTCLQKMNQPDSGTLELPEKMTVSKPKCSRASVRCRAVDIGVRVVRGPDWNFGDQDEGEGHLGSVVDICTDDDNEYYPAQTAVVIWDNGEKNVYRIGLDKQYDLRLYDNAGIGVRHEVTCAGCGLQTVPGILWRCNICTGVALCSSCYFEDKHDTSHKFMRLDCADNEGEDIPPRVTSRKVPAYGLFEKAKVVRGPDWRWDNQDGGPNKTGEIIAVINYSSDTNHNAAEVTWENGYANVYRLGYKGYLDVKLVKPSTGKFYYRDHLPIIKINMTKKEPPTISAEPPASSAPPDPKLQDSTGEAASSSDRFQAGDHVRIEIEPDILKIMEESRGSWNEGMLECLGLTGTVLIVKGNEVTVDFGSAGKWTFHEQCLNEVKEFAPGQLVQVMDNISTVKKMQEERVGWNEKMSKVIGKKGQVDNVDEDGDVQVSFGDYTWTFCVDCLVATQGKPDVISYEEEEVPAFSQPDTEEITSNTLFASIIIGDFNGVKNILQKNQEMMLLKDEEDKTPLHMASNCGNVEIVEFLCQQGVPLDDVDGDGNTPLLVASNKGHLDVMKLLIEKGANKNAKNNNDEGAIFLIVSQRNKDGLKLLHEFECDINSKDNLNQSPLYEAINSGDEELLSIILEWPHLDISNKDNMGFSPLCYACKKGSLYAVKRLLQMGADVNDQRKNTGYTCLHLAVYNNRRDIVEYLLKMPNIDKECRTKEGQSALHIATKEGFFDIIKLLIESGLDINGIDNIRNTCLHYSVNRKVTQEDTIHAETIVRYLIQKGVDVNFRNQDEQTAFDLAPDQLKVLLEPRFHAEVNIDSPSSLPASSYNHTAEDVGPTSLPANLAPPMCGECEEEKADFLLLPCGHGICKDCKGVKPKKKCPYCTNLVNTEKVIKYNSYH